MVNWSELPKDLLFHIAKCLESYFDLLHFRSVSPNWRASAPLNLLLPPTFCSHVGGLIKEAVESLLIKHTIFLIEIPADRSQMTPCSWLVKIEEDKFGKQHILDPLSFAKLKPVGPVRYPLVLDISEVRIQELSHEYLLRKTFLVGGYFSYTDVDHVAFMTTDSNDDDDHHHFMLLGEEYLNGPLRLFKSMDKERSIINIEDWDRCLDVIQFKRKFYAVDSSGKTICVEPCSGTFFLVEKGSTNRGESKFLVESCGKLLFVELFTTPTPGIKPEVFQLDEERNKWDRLESLGDRILFLAEYCKFSAPAIHGVEGNCIVFNLLAGFETGTMPVEGWDLFDFKSGKRLSLNHRPNLCQLFIPH